MALATVGILSIGDMGLGIAKMLLAHNYRVITNASDRSNATKIRAKSNSIELMPSDVELCTEANYILSIVPPRDSFATAQRVVNAASDPLVQRRQDPLYFIDLNAISPRSAREIDILFKQSSSILRFIDGGIIGGPPSSKDGLSWDKPRIPVSGPYRLDQAQPSGQNLSEVLNMKHINDTVGSATGLKMCFASLSKGFTALAIQSYTTAQKLGVTKELQDHLDEFNPSGRTRAERSLVAMPPKAYRWVHEMEEIADTFEADGGFTRDESSFRSIAKIYDLVANGTELGNEKTENRSRGKTPEDVAKLMGEGTKRRLNGD